MSLSHLKHPKRGYLANILTLPPLIYPFQYNPYQLKDSKQIKWADRETLAAGEQETEAAAPSLLASFSGIGAASGFGATVDALGSAFTATKEFLGQSFSGAHLRALESMEDRQLNFTFVVDGREKRPGEPDRRRNEEGDILADLAIIRTLVYPQFSELMDLMGAVFGDESDRWSQAFFNEPPSVTLIMGDMSMEGLVTDLNITETLFNSELDPVRAEVEITMIEKVDSISFIVDSVKRLGRTFYHTAYEDIGDVII